MRTRRTTTVIVGGGQAGLAMSRCLTDEGVDHVVLERGRTAERWRSERWDSLRLLTPNWQSRLPGFTYRGPDLDGYMTMPEIIGHLETYARSFAAPVHEETAVTSIRPYPGGYRVDTSSGRWEADTVVVATGAAAQPWRPELASRLTPSVHQLAPTRYRNPEQLPDGGVLVVGASASGVQLADEIAAAGRQVVLSVSEHNRLPRTYRGRDIQRWLDLTGVWDQDIDAMRRPGRAQRAPSLQLIGTPDRRSIDLGTLQRRGVRLAGRLHAADGTRVAFYGNLAGLAASSERRMHRLLDKADAWIHERGEDADWPVADRPDPIDPGPGPAGLDLGEARIGTVIWATGFRRRYPWLDVPVLGPDGDILHRRGITPAPGLYVLGMPAQMRRNSTFIDGVGRDARELTTALRCHLEARSHADASRRAARGHHAPTTDSDHRDHEDQIR